MRTITDSQSAKLALLAMRHATRIPRSADGYAADVANAESTPAVRAGAIAMLARHCPEYAAEANEILALPV